MAQTILLVDDDPDIIKLLTGYLEKEGFSVLSAGDGLKALEVLQRVSPDLAVLDQMLPGVDGLEILRRIRRNPAGEGLPVLFLTARVDDTDKIVGLELGADDYVTKPFNPREVTARIKALLRRSGSGRTIPQKFTVGALSLDPGSREVLLEDRPLDLTPSEFRILALLMENPGYTLPRDELLEKGIGYSYEGLGRTLDTHIKNIRKKLGVEPEAPEYIQTVYSVGYKLKGEG